MSTWPSPGRTPPPQVSGERDSLDAWVDYHRATLLLKCAGLDPEQLTSRSCPPSTLSLLGLVRHLTKSKDDSTTSTANPRVSGTRPRKIPTHASARSIPRVPRTIWRRTERARTAVKGRTLDEISPEPDDGRPVSLRWIYLQMIEEYARHNGHADLLRERIDGTTGD